MKLVEEADERQAALLLALSMGISTPGKAASAVAEYRSSPNRRLFLCEADGVIVGCVGVSWGQDAVVLEHLAVSPDRQRHGIGSFMVRAVMGLLGIDCLRAETDGDAVGFYRKCGFRVTSLGELYPNTERFLCVVSA